MYRIRKEYWDRWGSDVNEGNCEVSCQEIEELAIIWGMSFDELLTQVEALPESDVASDFIDQSYHFWLNSANGSMIAGTKATGDVACGEGKSLFLEEDDTD